MYPEEELLPISALQHLIFCERQWALIHLENQWEENSLTLEGRFLHDRVDKTGTEVRGSIRITRGLSIRSLEWGLVGRADVVEFHRVSSMVSHQGDETSISHAVALDGASGLWAPVPVEYKRGRQKSIDCDKVQLCAQALCLEEMLEVHIPSGQIFYGKTRKRLEVAFDSSMRKETLHWIARLHKLSEKEITPKARYEKKCDQCSLIDRCLPKTFAQFDKVHDYFQKNLKESMDTILD